MRTGAQKSVRDSEAAADAGTLRIIGNEKGIAYGKTLIAVAKEMPDQTERNRVLTCSTGAAGGMRAMKERMKMIVNQPQTKMITVFVLALLCACTVGCTFTGAVKGGQGHADVSETEENATVGEEEESAAAGAGEEEESESKNVQKPVRERKAPRRRKTIRRRMRTARIYRRRRKRKPEK